MVIKTSAIILVLTILRLTILGGASMRTGHLAFLAALTCLFTTPAHAYLDPGTGSMILQGIIGAIAVGAAYISIFWHRVKSLFSPSSRTASKSLSSNDTSKN